MQQQRLILRRAIPVCADIDLSLNLDPVDLERRITPRTKAVVVVHMLGTQLVCQKSLKFVVSLFD